MPEEKKRTFDDDDLFQRKSYAEFLKNLILNCGNYHRDDDIKAYTIALDSPWGTGKSVFLEKFESMLAQKCSDTICVVHYNAWKSDFWSNAFEPFVEALFSSECFARLLLDQSEGKASQKFISACKDFGIAFLKGQLEKQVDVDRLEKSIQGFKSAFDVAVEQKSDAITDNYKTYTKHLKDLQNAMEGFLSEALPDGKLLIVIDELDRCKPTFAIETLEIVKHIMDVPNVVYMFSLDVKQLGAAVKQVYGPDTDATGYLMRFFSYYSRLPEASTTAMIGRLIDSTKNIDEKELIKEDLLSIAPKFQLSPRDIETIGKVYQLMMNNFLSSYKNRQAYLLYWTLLCWKYKKPSSFANLSKGSVSELLHDFLFSNNRQKNLCVRTALEIVQQNKPLKSYEFSRLSIDSTSIDSRRIIHKIEPDNGVNRIKIVWKHGEYSSFSDTDFSKDLSLSGILFTEDLLHWDKIKDLTPGQFLFRQMEMFNFLPTIK